YGGGGSKSGGAGVALLGGGYVDNAGGRIAGTGDGVSINGAAGTVTNSGTISTHSIHQFNIGILLGQGGTVVDSGTIDAADPGGGGTAIAFFGTGSNLL